MKQFPTKSHQRIPPLFVNKDSVPFQDSVPLSLDKVNPLFKKKDDPLFVNKVNPLHDLFSLKKREQVPDSLKLKKLKFLIQNSKVNPFFLEKNNLDFRSLIQPRSLLGLSKDFSLYFSLLNKPINLLFSLDQFLFEFSKKIYQQRKTGEFLQQLKERKKFSLFYGHLTRKQFVSLFKKIQQTKGGFSKNFLSLLERRLDVVLYRSGIAKTIAEARQLINHKKILVNSCLVTVPGLFINPGDVISLTSETKKLLSDQLFEKMKNDFNSCFSTKNLTKSRKTKIFGDFFLKLNFILDKSLKNHQIAYFLSLSKKQQKKEINFLETKLLCKILTQLVCTKMKLRSFFSLKKNLIIQKSILETIILEQQKFSSNIELRFFARQRSPVSFFSEKTIFTSLKRKLNSVKTFSSLEQKKSFIQFKENQQQNVYANLGFLQKKPIFWSNDFFYKKSDYKWNTKSSSYYLKESLAFFQLDKMNVKSSKKEQLAFYRQSFLFFFKHLENHTNFKKLMILKMKKSLFKKAFLKKKNFLTFRIIKPLNLEVSYKLLNVIYLYSPQRLNFPFFIDLDKIHRSLR